MQSDVILLYVRQPSCLSSSVQTYFKVALPNVTVFFHMNCTFLGRRLKQTHIWGEGIDNCQVKVIGSLIGYLGSDAD